MAEPTQEVQLLDVGKYADKCGYWCVFFEQTRDSSLLELLKEEKRNAGLEETDISLFLPEEGTYELVHGLNPGRIGSAVGSRDKRYTITLYPLALERESKVYGYDCRRSIIRHELAHIKFGDCDRKFPKGLRWLQKIYTSLVEEPRAGEYERGGISSSD